MDTSSKERPLPPAAPVKPAPPIIHHSTSAKPDTHPWGKASGPPKPLPSSTLLPGKK